MIFITQTLSATVQVVREHIFTDACCVFHKEYNTTFLHLQN